MSSITDFVVELVRAANEIDRLGDFERRRLLDRAYRTIQDARNEVGMEQDGTDYDAAIDFLTMSRAPEKFSIEEFKEAFLEAADMIRTLKIILDAKDEVTGRKN